MKLLLSAVLSFALMLSQRDFCLAQTWSGNGPDSNWSTASNWVGGVAPVSAATTQLTFADPTIRNNPFQNIAEPFQLNRMTIDSSQGPFTFSGQTIEFAGTSPWVYYGGSNPITFNNDWILSSNSGNQPNGAATELIHNGNIRGSGNFVLIQNAGFTINGSATGTGRWEVGGARLTVNGTVANSVQSIFLGAFSGGGPGNLRGTGTINCDVSSAFTTQTSDLNTIGSSGTLTINGNLTAISDAHYRYRIAEGTVALNGSTSVRGLLVTNGGTVFSGTGGISISGNGQLIANGLIAASRTILMDGSAPGGTFGSLMAGSGTIEAASTMNGGSVTGNLTINGNVTILVANSLAKVTSYGTNTTGGNVAFSRSNITTNGTVTFDATGATGNSNSNLVRGVHNGSGRFVINSGYTVEFDRAEIGSNLTVDVSGRVVMSSGDLTQPSVFNGTMNLASGRLAIGFDTNTINGQINSMGNSFVDFATTGTNFNGLVNVQSGTLTVGGIMQGTGSMTVLEGANQTHQNSNSRMRLTLNAFGNIVGTTGSRYENTVNLLGATMSGPLTMDGAVNVGNNEISNLLSGSTMTVAGLTSVNTGTLRIAANANLTGSGNLIVNPGAILDVQGTVSKNIQVAEDAFLRGVGELIGTIEVQGTLEPGNSAGTQTINGTIDLGATSTVCIEVGGTTPGTGFDLIRGTGGNPTLLLRGGDLLISLINGFVPDPTHQFSIFNNFSSITGTFGNDGGGDSGRIYFDGGSFAINYAATSIVLSDFQAVPDPTAGLVLAMSALAFSFRRRR